MTRKDGGTPVPVRWPESSPWWMPWNRESRREPAETTCGWPWSWALRCASRTARATLRVRLPVRDREQKILPHISRYHNKKEVHGEEWYREQMEGWKRDPQG